jgi:hypothetical protein
VGLIIITFANYNLNTQYLKSQIELNEVAIDCADLSKHIEPNSVVLPLNFSGHWITGHFSNYLGIDKPMIILENYECSVGYFPVTWNDQEFPNFTLDNLSPDKFEYFGWKINESNSKKPINYLFVLGPFIGYDAPQNIELEQLILEHCELIASNKNACLYKVK